jgi:hypothetical protein
MKTWASNASRLTFKRTTIDLGWCEIAYATMSMLMILPVLGGELYAGFPHRLKGVHIQPFLAPCLVDALPVAVLTGTSWVDVEGHHLVLHPPPVPPWQCTPAHDRHGWMEVGHTG